MKKYIRYTIKAIAMVSNGYLHSQFNNLDATDNPGSKAGILSLGRQTMKLEKAIEILSEDVERMNPDIDPDEKAALKLGIEALKFKKAIRAHTVDDFDALLPGETE